MTTTIKEIIKERTAIKIVENSETHEDAYCELCDKGYEDYEADYYTSEYFSLV